MRIARAWLLLQAIVGTILAPENMDDEFEKAFTMDRPHLALELLGRDHSSNFLMRFRSACLHEAVNTVQAMLSHEWLTDDDFKPSDDRVFPLRRILIEVQMSGKQAILEILLADSRFIQIA